MIFTPCPCTVWISTHAKPVGSSCRHALMPCHKSRRGNGIHSFRGSSSRWVFGKFWQGVLGQVRQKIDDFAIHSSVRSFSNALSPQEGRRGAGAYRSRYVFCHETFFAHLYRRLHLRNPLCSGAIRKLTPKTLDEDRIAFHSQLIEVGWLPVENGARRLPRDTREEKRNRSWTGCSDTFCRAVNKVLRGELVSTDEFKTCPMNAL